MLENELRELEGLLTEKDYSDSDRMSFPSFQIHLIQIRKAWEQALFSNANESSLVRYFAFHLDIITKLSNSLKCTLDSKKFAKHQKELLALIDYIQDYHICYFNKDADVPLQYHERLVNQLGNEILGTSEMLKRAKVSSSLIACLLTWLSEMNENIGVLSTTFRKLDYFESILHQLTSVDYHSDDAESLLVSILLHSNFNHLSFFVFMQNDFRKSCESISTVKEKLSYLHQQKAIILSTPERKNIAYDPSWPSIKTMVSGWLMEEILLLEKSLTQKDDITIPKIPLELSVAHMACLIRLLYEESIFATQNLQFIFKSFAGHYQSKRQRVISPGSLSKEFYSIDQHTAARVRDLLQRMVLRINRNFFPMCVVANATILSFLSIH